MGKEDNKIFVETLFFLAAPYYQMMKWFLLQLPVGEQHSDNGNNEAFFLSLYNSSSVINVVVAERYYLFYFTRFCVQN